MHRIFTAAALCCALGACQTAATTPSPGVGASVGATIGAIAQEKAPPAVVAKVQTTAVKVCGFEPTAATVARILGTMSGFSLFVDPVVDVADRICAAVTSPAAYAALKRRKARATKPKGEVNGVPIQGRFVPPPSK